MFETPAILLRQIALKIATCLHMRFWSYNFSATKIACVNGPLHSWVIEYLFFSLALLSVCEGWSVLSIQFRQLYRQRLFHNSTKAHATMLIGIMGNNSLAPLRWGSRCLARRKKNVWIHVFVLFPSLTPKYLALKSIKGKTTVRHCGVQPFSKQLYTYSYTLHSLSINATKRISDRSGRAEVSGAGDGVCERTTRRKLIESNRYGLSQDFFATFLLKCSLISGVLPTYAKWQLFGVIPHKQHIVLLPWSPFLWHAPPPAPKSHQPPLCH